MLLKVLTLIIFLLPTLLSAENKKVGLFEKQDEYVPINLEFTNEYNQNVKLEELLLNKPTIITFNYFNCPTLCSPQLFSVATVLDTVFFTDDDSNSNNNNNKNTNTNITLASLYTTRCSLLMF